MPHSPDRHAPREATPNTTTPAATSLTLGTLLERVDVGAFTVTRSRYEPGQRLAAHSHDFASATVVLHGGLTERVAGRRFECTPERFLVRPAAAVHENAYGRTGAECVIVGARPEWVESDRVGRAVFAAPIGGASPSALGVARRIRRELRMQDRAAELAIEGLALELVAAAARQIDEPRGRIAPSWLRAVRDRLCDDHTETPRLYTLAGEAGVHPVHLSRAFRRWFGCSPGDYVRQRRIDGACAELATTQRSIAEVAVDAGFASPSHFATAFRRATGCSPSAYRASRRR